MQITEQKKKNKLTKEAQMLYFLQRDELVNYIVF